MPEFKVTVSDKEGIFDAAGEGILKDIRDLGITGIESVRFSALYYLKGGLDADKIKRLSEELLIDKIVQEYFIGTSCIPECPGAHVIEIAYNPGVMDPAEESILKASLDLGITGLETVKTARQYLIKGGVSDSTIKNIAQRLLYNKLIQHIVERPSPSEDTKSTAIQPGARSAESKFKLIEIELLEASDKQLLGISQKGQLFLNLAEMRRIQAYFKKMRRNPTDIELETIAQTWSEHCVHKTFRGKIEYEEAASNQKKEKRKIINNLLKSTIMKVTEELNKPWCVSVFKDNAGIIKFDDKYNICFKVETHNHPSALEPFGGANTGIGGVIRDPLGTGLGAKPIFNTDVFCFGRPDMPHNRVPAGSLHPKRIAKGVVSGVRDYGNKMGIPTVNGAVLFDNAYVCNPLVYCGTAGLIPKDKSFKKVSKGDLIVAVGGRTGRDGIHGATFSSGELTHESEEISSGAVQIGNPITEKKMLDTLLKARDLNLYTAITDCGAGGFSSAVGEMGQELGARVMLEKAPLKYQGLTYAEIWISEAQERMILAIRPEDKEKLLKIFSDEDVEATVIGEFTGTSRLELFYHGSRVAALEMKFLHEGPPKTIKKACWVIHRHKEPRLGCPKGLTPFLRKILGHYSVASKEWIIRQYDHEVQGATVMKPFSGVCNDGPSDAAIVKPLVGSKKGVIASCGINFRYGLIDPYWMAASCIDEALRQIIAVGGSLKQAALLDNFCWGNPDKPDRLGGMVRAALACYDIAKGFGVPFISGKDSLNNEYSINGKSQSIPGTLLISALAVMDDIGKAVSMDVKSPGNLIYAVGNTYNELGGSFYFDTLGFVGNHLPKVNPKKALNAMQKLSLAINKGLVRAAHDCSEGGLGVALSEMSFAGGCGMEIFLSEVPYESQKRYVRNDFILFSESNSRFVVEVEKNKQKEFEKIMKEVSIGLIGCVSENRDFTVYGLDSKPCVKADIGDLKETWQKPLRW